MDRYSLFFKVATFVKSVVNPVTKKQKQSSLKHHFFNYMAYWAHEQWSNFRQGHMWVTNYFYKVEIISGKHSISSWVFHMVYMNTIYYISLVIFLGY